MNNKQKRKTTKDSIDARAIKVAEYIVDTEDTIRGAASVFGISKSTIHKDLTERLELLDLKLSYDVKKVLKKNKSERHIRGGIATKRKYSNLKLSKII